MDYMLRYIRIEFVCPSNSILPICDDVGERTGPKKLIVMIILTA